jgi:hypothetical protein
MCASDTDCNPEDHCDFWRQCVPRRLRLSEPADAGGLEPPTRKSAANGMIGAGMFFGVLGSAINLATWLAVAEYKPSSLDLAADWGYASIALMSAGAVATGGFVLRAMVSHDEHICADHGRVHARQRWRTGLGILIAGAAMTATAVALIPVAQGLGTSKDREGNASTTQVAALFSWPALLTFGNALLSVGIPLFLVGQQDGGGLRF